jgi:2-polyprenyl-3-methyl-5-hydroxy-6-metoxy-1,4-benzoquinol methylase
MDDKEPASLLGPGYEAIAKDGALALELLGLTPDAAVLDVGTGGGNFAIFLANRGFDVLTGEPATDKTLYARQPWQENAARVGVADRIRFQPFAAQDMPFTDGRFDAVFFAGVLHHVDEGLRPAVMREAFRVAKPGGAVVFLEPQASLLARVRERDANHPPAADPALYLGDQQVGETRRAGAALDIILYRMPG